MDDYGAIPACRLAVDDFRRTREIQEPIVEIDYTGIYWIKRANSCSTAQLQTETRLREQR